MKRTPVFSSNIANVGYNAKTRVLTLEFRNNRIYEYEGVEVNVHADLMLSPSTGKFFFDRIRGQYPETEITPVQPEPIKGNVS